MKHLTIYEDIRFRMRVAGAEITLQHVTGLTAKPGFSQSTVEVLNVLARLKSINPSTKHLIASDAKLLDRAEEADSGDALSVSAGSSRSSFASLLFLPRDGATQSGADEFGCGVGQNKPQFIPRYLPLLCSTPATQDYATTTYLCAEREERPGDRYGEVLADEDGKAKRERKARQSCDGRV